MINVNLSEAYRILLESKSMFAQSTMNVATIEAETVEVDDQLLRQVKLFNEWLIHSRDSLVAGDTERVGNNLVHVRAHAMNISSIFLNLADLIEDHVFLHPPEDGSGKPREIVDESDGLFAN